MKLLIYQIKNSWRWVTAEFEVHEEFVGLHVVASIDSNTIFAKIIDALEQLNLSRALYTHCYGHALN